ncbi:unnamed protein product [Prorocentrum cordatum]|uniref:Eukaryotic translation initiation factor 4E n=1 Tax=Prorocentrum cordatum TaxID=2364126 RepID=A0ABN9X313_9DINO|nr:unnamed protein product [Polarella glacialis]|mmetsp:Transcript_86869/g.226724  ORF Transcript_86869/g.226724 Transcript_86869/m.226724 type:complete len:230 (-) Transcript_86869:57-746(-)
MSRDRMVLSFNEERHGKFTIPGYPEDESREIEEALRQPMYLHSGWTLWTQNSGQYAVQKVVAFETAQEFWKVWNGVPQPSELFDSKRFIKETTNGTGVAGVDGFMIFRNAIKPEWEDPANAKGGHFQILVKPTSGGGTLDEWWNNLVLGMIGETIECSHRINGVRLLDKMGSSKGKVLDNVRLEIWYHGSTTHDEGQQLRKSLEKCLITQLDGTLGPAFKPDMMTDKRH